MPRRTPRRRPAPTVECPYCGETLRAGALACRSCGADADTGWKEAEDLELASTELPEFDADDYARVVAEIQGRSTARTRLPTWVRATAVVVLVVFALWVLGIL